MQHICNTDLVMLTSPPNVAMPVASWSLKENTVSCEWVQTFRTKVLFLFSALRMDVVCQFETSVFTRPHDVITRKLTQSLKYLQNGECVQDILNRTEQPKDTNVTALRLVSQQCRIQDIRSVHLER